MKYLIHIRPSEEIFQKVVEFRNSLGLRATSHTPHCTLLIGTLNESSEGSFIKNLESLCGSSVPVQLGEFDLFDKQSLIVRLHKTDPLVALHYAVIKAAMLSEFNCARKEYLLDKYNPHITIGHHGEGFILPGTNPFMGERFDVGSFHLSRTPEQGPKSWEYVKEFPLRTQS